MNTLKYSLATLLALGMVNCVAAETQQGTETMDAESIQAETIDEADTAKETTDKSVAPSTKTSIMDALKGTTIGGYVYAQYTGMFGDDADGQALRFRVLMDVNTGAYHGFSIGTRVFAQSGAGGPNGGDFLSNSAIGSSGVSPAANIPIYLTALYGRQTFESSATVITAGKINLITPFNDKVFDFGYGASVDNYDVKGIGFHLQAYGAWGLDIQQSSSTSATTSKSGIASDKGLFILGVSGDRKELAGFGFELWGAHAPEAIDFLTFADLNYTIAGVTLQAQVATTQVNQSSRILNSSALTKKEEFAKLRGLYNAQLAYKHTESGFLASAGYTGSFGDGYGALLNNSASFNMGGKIWYDTVAVGLNGYGIGGAGSFKLADGVDANGNLKSKSSTIQVAYLSLGYKGVKNLSLGLDYAFVETNSYTPMLKAARNPKEQYYDFHEVSLTIDYAFNDKFSMQLLGGSTFGDLQMARARAKFQYSF